MIQSCNWLGNSAEVSLIQVLHEPVQPGATIFIWRLEAVSMSSLFPADLFLAWFIHRAARHDYLENFLSFIARFYALPLDLTDFSKPHVQYNSTPSTSLILQPLEYTTLLRYSHIPNIHRKFLVRQVQRRPNIRFHSVLFFSQTPLIRRLMGHTKCPY